MLCMQGQIDGQQISLKIIHSFCMRPQKKVRQPCPRLKKFQECRFESEQNY